jgi:hypothetical protein
MYVYIGNNHRRDRNMLPYPRKDFTVSSELNLEKKYPVIEVIVSVNVFFVKK